MKTWLCGLVVVMGFAPAVRADPQGDAATAYANALYRQVQADTWYTAAMSHRSDAWDMWASETTAHVNYYGGLTQPNKNLVDNYESNTSASWSLAEASMQDGEEIEYCEAISWMSYGEDMFALADYAEAQTGFEAAEYYFSEAKLKFSSALTDYDTAKGQAEAAFFVLIP